MGRCIAELWLSVGVSPGERLGLVTAESGRKRRIAGHQMALLLGALRLGSVVRIR